jgi:predicted tellurium resistance membrane protein TerC
LTTLSSSPSWAGKLPANQQDKARRLGIGLAVFSRILLLLGISWVIQLTEPIFTILGNEISGRDMILLGGGLFLIAKSTHEIHEKLEAVDDREEKAKRPPFTPSPVSLSKLCSSTLSSPWIQLSRPWGSPANWRS